VEENVEEADTRKMGRRSPGGRGRSGGRRPRSEDRRRQTGSVAGGEGVGGSVDGGFREVGGDGEPRGAEDGGRSGRRRSGRMTIAVEEDTTTTMAADRGRKSGQVLEGEGRCFYI
jgi:hypothetical protein